MSNSQSGAHQGSPTNERSTDTESTTSSDVAEDVHPTDLTQFQLNILAVIANYDPKDSAYEMGRTSKGQPYGLAIKRDLEEYYQTEINHGRLYPNLDDLVEDGLVAKSELDKRTNQYELTEAGAIVLHRQTHWLAEAVMGSHEGVEDILDQIDAASEQHDVDIAGRGPAGSQTESEDVGGDA